MDHRPDRARRAWPRDAVPARAYDDIERDYVVPSTSVFGITYGMVAPTILGFGTEHCKRSYLAGLYRGDVLGCQLFSEPGAGSDVASPTTRAVRDGDGG